MGGRIRTRRSTSSRVTSTVKRSTESAGLAVRQEAAARDLRLARRASGVDYYKAFTSRPSSQAAIEADHFERRQVVICGDQCGCEPQAVRRPQWMHAKQSFRRAPDRVAGNDFVPRCSEAFRCPQRSVRLLRGNPALAFATSDRRCHLRGSCPPRHDLRIPPVQLEQSLARRLVDDQRKNGRRIPVSHQGQRP